jgi:hypothetical protein
MNTVLILLGALLSACLYRLGGAGNHGQWYAKLLDTRWRDWGCPLVVVLLVSYLFFWHWTLILTFCLMWGALSTYWKKSADARWIHWLAHGLGIAISLLPFVIVQGSWIGFGLICLLLPVSMMAWTHYLKNPIVEELGRGALIVLSIPLLYL